MENPDFNYENKYQIPKCSFFDFWPLFLNAESIKRSPPPKNVQNAKNEGEKHFFRIIQHAALEEKLSLFEKPDREGVGVRTPPPTIWGVPPLSFTYHQGGHPTISLKHRQAFHASWGEAGYPRLRVQQTLNDKNHYYY